MRFVIVSVFNNLKQYNDMIESAKCDYYTRNGDTYGIDNRDGKFTSAASAYNFALREKKGYDVYIFCHQDVRFFGDSLEKICECSYKEKDTLFGIAGETNGGKIGRVISSISDTKYNYHSLKTPVKECFTLDECLIAGSNNIFKYGFNERLCDGWHLYSAELCLRIRKQGKKIKVINVDMIHLSNGHIDKNFNECLDRIQNEYRNDYKVITTTCGYRYNNKFIYCVHSVLYIMKCVYRIFVGVYRNLKQIIKK